jgi:hypothetical protein
MHEDRTAARSLIAGTVMALATMAMHPTGTALLRDYDATVVRNAVAHGLAIAAIAPTLLGLLALTRRLRSAGAPALADGAMLVQSVAMVAVLIAGVASGLTGPMVAARLLDAEPAAAATWRALFSYNGMINQGFAAVYVAGTGLAVLLWSVAIWRTRALPRWLATLGAIVGGGLLVLILSGRTHLDVHTFGLIVLALSAWLLGVAARLLQSPPPAP